MNPASYWLGARYTPLRIMCQKKSLKPSVSAAEALAKFVTGPSARNRLTIEPTWFTVYGRSPCEAASSMPRYQRAPSSSRRS